MEETDIIIETDGTIKTGTRLQDEVDFLMRHVDESTLAAEFQEEYAYVNDDGTINEYSLHDGIEIMGERNNEPTPVAASRTYAEAFRPFKNDAIYVKDMISDKVGQTLNKEQVRKGFAVIVGSIIYHLFRKIEE